MRGYFTIEERHVGVPFIRELGDMWSVSGFAGRILPQDVGKRVYLVGNVLQMENDEQSAKRLGGVK